MTPGRPARPSEKALAGTRARTGPKSPRRTEKMGLFGSFEIFVFCYNELSKWVTFFCHSLKPALDVPVVPVPVFFRL